MARIAARAVMIDRAMIVRATTGRERIVARARRAATNVPPARTRLRRIRLLRSTGWRRDCLAAAIARRFLQPETDMASFNKVMLIGNLTRDPQLKYLPSQTRGGGVWAGVQPQVPAAHGEDREEVTFVDCSCLREDRRSHQPVLQKGKPIFIEGRLKFDQWEDKQGGGKRSKLTVVVENFQFVGGRDGGGGGGGGGGRRTDDDGARPPTKARPPPPRQRSACARPAPAQRQQRRRQSRRSAMSSSSKRTIFRFKTVADRERTRINYRQLTSRNSWQT